MIFAVHAVRVVVGRPSMAFSWKVVAYRVRGFAVLLPQDHVYSVQAASLERYSTDREFNSESALTNWQYEYANKIQIANASQYLGRHPGSNPKRLSALVTESDTYRSRGAGSCVCLFRNGIGGTGYNFRERTSFFYLIICLDKLINARYSIPPVYLPTIRPISAVHPFHLDPDIQHSQ